MNFWSEIKQALKVAVCAAIPLGIPTVMLLSCIEDCTKKQDIKPPLIEASANCAGGDRNGGVQFGNCPVLRRTEMPLAKITEVVKESLTTENLAKQPQNLTTADSSENNGLRGNSEPGTQATSKNVETTLQNEVVAKFATTEPATEPLTAEPVCENYTLQEPVTENNNDGYIGTFYITGYTAEEGFPEGSPTGSGYGVRHGFCAMNLSQMDTLGIQYGDQIRVEGLGTYMVMDSGCDWGVVDIWVYTNAEAYAITGSYDVYLV